MDKIETPEEFFDRVAIDYISGPYSLRKVLMDNTSGRDALPRADERRKAAGWISVKERLPENGMEVLACGNNYNNALKGQHRVVVNFIENQFFAENGEGERDRMDYITHWMLLPEPPAIMAEPEEGMK